MAAPRRTAAQDDPAIDGRVRQIAFSFQLTETRPCPNEAIEAAEIK